MQKSMGFTDRKCRCSAVYW